MWIEPIQISISNSTFYLLWQVGTWTQALHKGSYIDACECWWGVWLGPELCPHDHAGARRCKQMASVSEYTGRIQVRLASGLAADAITHQQCITSTTQCTLSPQLKHGVWHLVRDAPPSRPSLHTLQANALPSFHSLTFPNSQLYTTVLNMYTRQTLCTWV